MIFIRFVGNVNIFSIFSYPNFKQYIVLFNFLKPKSMKKTVLLLVLVVLAQVLVAQELRYKDA